MPSADEILLNRTGDYPEKLSGLEEQNSAARALRYEQTVGREKNQTLASTFNQGRFENLNNEKLDVEQKAEDKIENTPAAIASAWWLRKSWFMLPSVLGFIPAFLYINVHWFMGAVVGKKFFCDLGEEWSMAGGGISKPNILKYGTKAAGLGEKALMVLIDALFLIVVLVVIFFLILMDNAGQAIVEAGWQAISDWAKSTFGS